MAIGDEHDDRRRTRTTGRGDGCRSSYEERRSAGDRTARGEMGTYGEGFRRGDEQPQPGAAAARTCNGGRGDVDGDGVFCGGDDRRRLWRRRGRQRPPPPADAATTRNDGDSAAIYGFRREISAAAVEVEDSCSVGRF
ncbi:hypothetical protein Scep_006853 [Stephania cephalantha]|uniref:Uncharacterized protein n=1 Tax=Stephania cephalantha TaxID=152367 RepID=A0AAP0K8Z0_9MAGN